MPLTVDPQVGFIAQTAEEIYAELAAGLVASTERPDLDTSTDSPTGRLLWPFVVQFATFQLALVQFPWLFDPATVAGAPLDIVNALRGTRRLPATNSRVSLRITGVPTTDIGGVLVTTGENDQWMVLPPAVISASGVALVDAEATDAGDITPGDAWTTVAENANIFTVEQVGDTQPGQDAETAEANRARLAGVAEASTSTQPGNYDAILAVPGIDRSTLWIHHNPTDSVDPRTGNPKRSVEVVVAGGSLPALGNAVRAGISEVATNVGELAIQVVVPETGETKIYYVTRPTPLRGYATVTLDTGGGINNLPAGYEATVRAAVEQWANTLSSNVLAESSSAIAAVRAVLPAGTVPVISVTLGLTPGPATQLIDPGPRQFVRIAGGPTGATVVGNLGPTFAIDAASILTIASDAGADFIVFPDALPAATTEQIVDHINATATLTVASGDPNGQIRITTIGTGASRTIEVVVGSTPSLVAALGLPAGVFAGSDTDVGVITV
ncbi:MAG: hypothetical protein ACPG4T_14010 [Nannocystaceae bacterium]